MFPYQSFEPHLLSAPPPRGWGVGGLGMMKSSPKEEAKDVNEPVKSPMTAVTTVAPAIKHGALTAPEIHLGHLSAAPACHTCTCEPSSRMHAHRRSSSTEGQNRKPWQMVSAIPLASGLEGWGPGLGVQASFHSLYPPWPLPLSDHTLSLHSTHLSPVCF